MITIMIVYELQCKCVVIPWKERCWDVVTLDCCSCCPASAVYGWPQVRHCLVGLKCVWGAVYTSEVIYRRSFLLAFMGSPKQEWNQHADVWLLFLHKCDGNRKSVTPHCLRMTPPPPLCVLLYLKLAYCVRPCHYLAYCVPFNNRNNLFGPSIYIKKIKKYRLRRHNNSCSLIVLAW